MPSRRAVLGGGATWLTVVAGCSDRFDSGNERGDGESRTKQGGNDASTRTESTEPNAAVESELIEVETNYTDWFGPEMAGTPRGRDSEVIGPDYVDVNTVRPGPLSANDHVPDWLRDRWTRRTLDTKAGASFEFEADTVDRWWYDTNNTYTFATGSLDVAAMKEGLPDDATDRGSHRGHDLYTAPTKGGWEGYHHAYAFSSEHFLAGLAAPEPETALSFVRRAIDTERGDEQKYKETNATFARVVDELGDGVRVRVFRNGERVDGVRLRLDGPSVRRRSVIGYESATAASDDDMADEQAIEQMRESSDDGAPRTVRDKFSVYEDVERTRHGRFVVIDGTLPAEKVMPIDFRSP